MRDDGATEAFASVVATDPDVLEREGLGELTRAAARLRGWLDAVDVRIARRARQLAAEGRSESAAGVLLDEGRRSGREARATEQREETCRSMPGFEDALASGEISADHLDALGRATRGLSEEERAEFVGMADELLADARNSYVSQFGRSCRDLAARIRELHRDETSEAEELERQRRESKISRWVDEASGMHKTLIELDPVRDAAWWNAVEAELARIRHATPNTKVPFTQLQIDALLATATTNSGGKGVVNGVVVHIDEQTIRAGRHDATVCETVAGSPLPVATARRLACEAEVVPVVLSGDGLPLDVGRAARTATPAQRAALASIYRTCAHPDCEVSFDRCRIHHIVPWSQGGPTDLDNLLPLCELAGHHHLVHEGGWTITIDPATRTITWQRPDNTTWRTSHPDRQPTAA